MIKERKTYAKAKKSRDEPGSGDGSGNVSGACLNLTGSGHRSPKKLCFRANKMHHSELFQAPCCSCSHQVNTSQAMSCLLNQLQYIQIGCVCGHTHSSPPPAFFFCAPHLVTYALSFTLLACGSALRTRARRTRNHGAVSGLRHVTRDRKKLKVRSIPCWYHLPP